MKNQFAGFAAFAAALAAPVAVFACGFHSSFLARNVTPREWWEYHKHEYVEEVQPLPGQQVSGSREAEPGVFKESRSAPSGEKQVRQRALIAMVLNHLMYLTSTNVNPDEFPDFNVKSIPEYNRNFREILVELGAQAVPFILDAYLDTLRTQPADSMGLRRNAEFQTEMADVLARIGGASIAAIAEAAARTPAKREREALLDLASKVLKPDPSLRGVPALIKNALERWPEFGPELLEAANADSLGVSGRAVLADAWMGMSYFKRGTSEIFALLANKAAKEELRCRAVSFLSEKGVASAVAEFLDRALDGADGMYVRRECLYGIWRIGLVNTEAPMTAVTRSAGLKAIVTDPAAPKALRVVAMFLLARLRDDALLDALLLIVHRKDEDEGVRIAALEAVHALGAVDRAAARIDLELLASRAHVAAFRFGLLDIASSTGDRRLAPVLVKIALSRDEYPPMRLKAFSALHSLVMPGFDKASLLILDRSCLIEDLADFVFDSSVSFNERAGVLHDLEKLSSLQVREPVSRLFSSDKAEEAMRRGALTDEILAPMMDLFLRYKGSSAVPFVAALLEAPDARLVALMRAASWAARWKVQELAAPMKAAMERSSDPSFRLAAAVALVSMGEKTSASDLSPFMFPKKGPAPDSDTMAAALDVLSSLGDRESMALIVKCVKPAHEGDFDRTAAALRALGQKGSDARPWFWNVWTAFRRSELGNPQARSAFLECLLLMGPSRSICENLVSQAQTEMQRLPFSQAGAAPLPGDESIEHSRDILPPLHALALLNAYMNRSADLFDVGRAHEVHSRLMVWYMGVRKDLPKE